MTPFVPATNLEPLDRVSIPLPPPELQHQIFGHTVTLEEFLYGGYSLSEGIRDTLKLVGRPMGTFTSILDVGCGCGRVLRWLEPEAPHARLHGSDISEKAIGWDRANIPFARFEVNGMSSLPYADESFDLVLAISVVTHFDEELQLKWLEELRRVLRPGGILLMTVTGDETARFKLSGPTLESFQEKGHQYQRVQAGGLHGLPEYYQDAYHSRVYVERVWSRYFRIRGFLRHGPFYLQDAVVLEKVPPAEYGPRGYVWLDLPVFSIGHPTTASHVPGESMGCFGAVFHPRGGTAEVDVWIDGRHAARTLANVDSPKPGAVYAVWPSAARCVYEVWVPLGGLAKGAHTFKITANTNLVAGASTFFFT
jgi:SAM-dependent methyltransferase